LIPIIATLASWLRASRSIIGGHYANPVLHRGCSMHVVQLSRLLILPLLFGAPTNAQTPPIVAKAEQTKIFSAAGAVKRGKGWTMCAEDADSQGASIELYRDLNGDKLPEAVVVDGSAQCWGFTGAGYALVSRNAAGKWTRLDNGAGMLSFLKTKGVGGWPDMQVGGPGFCHPVLRWNGKFYTLNRHEYEGKRCTPTR
jgi:hypothetical protein